MSHQLTLDIASLLSSASNTAVNCSKILKDYIINFADGKLANQVDQVYSKLSTVGGNRTDIIDLTAVLKNEFNETVNFSNVKAFLVKAYSNNKRAISVYCPGANGFCTPFSTVAPGGLRVAQGGLIMLAAPDQGFAVSASTGEILCVSNDLSAEPAQYEIIFLGAEI